jgi:hypothetical protein
MAIPIQTANIYYNVTAVHSNDEKAFANAYVDISDWINQGSAQGQVFYAQVNGRIFFYFNYADFAQPFGWRLPTGGMFKLI